MKHSMLTFRLHRKGVAMVAVGAVLQGALLFAAGYLAGTRHAPPSASVPKPAPQEQKPAKQESAAKPHIEDEAFTLRVGAFADEADAKAFVQDMAALGRQATVVPWTSRSGLILHTVTIGQYKGRDEAASAAAELKQKEGISSAVVLAPRVPKGS